MTDLSDITITADSLRVAAFTSTTEGFDLDRAVSDIARIRAIKQALSMWEGELSEWVSDALGRNEIDVEGIGHVSVKHGAKRTEWDRRLLIRAVLDSRLVDPSTGEVADETIAEVAGEELSCSTDLARVLHVWNLGAPRVTALRERAIDPDEFCATSPGKVSVVIE